MSRRKIMYGGIFLEGDGKGDRQQSSSNFRKTHHLRCFDGYRGQENPTSGGHERNEAESLRTNYRMERDAPERSGGRRGKRETLDLSRKREADDTARRDASSFCESKEFQEPQGISR